MTRELACLTFHAELLHRDDVWRVVTRALDRLEAGGIRATFFVHPFAAIYAGVDIEQRIQEIGGRGHEIGQHTHYYGEYETIGDRVHKRTVLDPATVESALSRDRAYLQNAGFTPRGFVSGGWVILPTVFDWLQRNDFTYDCSYRTYPLEHADPEVRAGNGADAPFRITGLLELPTTAPLSAEVRRLGFGGNLIMPGLRYRMIYLHDSDLLHRGKAFAVGKLRPAIIRRAEIVTAGELADLVAKAMSSGDERHV